MIYIAARDKEIVDASSDQYIDDTTSQDDCDETTLLNPSVGLIHFLPLIRYSDFIV